MRVLARESNQLYVELLARHPRRFGVVAMLPSRMSTPRWPSGVVLGAAAICLVHHASLTNAVVCRHAVPPLTRTFCAVTQPAPSLAENATTAAISAGRPSLPNAPDRPGTARSRTTEATAGNRPRHERIHKCA
jgi:hypothetical protein